MICVFFFCSYKAPEEGAAPDDPTADYMNLLGMVFSMFGLMMKVCIQNRAKVWGGEVWGWGEGGLE